MTDIQRAVRTAPASHFSGGHTVQHGIVSEDRQWMPMWVWSLIGLLGAALLIAAMPDPGQDTPANTQGERT